MNNDWKPTEINEGQPTNWEPRKHHPEEVADGLRNAFRQAIKDGVMDATPYLKQMTFNPDIQKTEAEIKVLQKKLELLKEIETHKSQPKMEFDYGGKFEIVSYNNSVYYRLEFPDEFSWYKRDLTFSDGLMLVRITDGETLRLLEGLWFNEVRKGKYDEVECDEKDNPPYRITDEVVNRLIKQQQAQKLYNRLYDELGFEFDTCNDIVDIVEDWILDEQSASGSQNVNTELLVEGFNDAIRKMKEMLR